MTVASPRLRRAGRARCARGRCRRAPPDRGRCLGPCPADRAGDDRRRLRLGLARRRLQTARSARAEAEHGNDLTLDLPLLAPPPLADWNVSSATLGPASDWASFGDTLPDWYIEGAYFTRGTGTPDYPPTCGPADPPLLLLPRGRG